MTPVGSRTALVVVDAQRVFTEPGQPWAAPAFAATVEPVRSLAAAHPGRTLFTRFLAPAEPRGAWQAYYDEWPFALQPADAPLWEVVPALADLVERPTVDATTFGKWDALVPRLATMADEGGEAPVPVERVVLCGVSTDCCVLSTALAAAESGVEVVVAADACAGASDADHERALDAMRLYAPLIRVTTTAAVLDGVTAEAAAARS
ncbi:cysteine hydrolase family protein [Cellulomonas marina]|uniref:Nicotinamidase-related amidase n=1 Tax=Cellulomonas marina TaxID=988821 RepID=A0A1I0YAF0_9CELL|nr:cysteine hydrolase [Cellulomonas marina]GIG29623.1 isochorismatase [Cellulomonas marina]SFB10375.1 Nicotinamidase-related amidase [Cellulomonas marina]